MQLQNAYKHNTRYFDVKNANPELIEENKNLIGLGNKSYEDIFKQELEQLKMLGLAQRTIRKDAVLGFEILMSFSREANGTFNILASV